MTSKAINRIASAAKLVGHVYAPTTTLHSKQSSISGSRSLARLLAIRETSWTRFEAASQRAGERRGGSVIAHENEKLPPELPPDCLLLDGTHRDVVAMRALKSQTKLY